MTLPEFSWLSTAPIPPGRWDLRQLGWTLGDPAADRPILLDWRGAWRIADWRERCALPQTLAIGVDCSETRAGLIGEGLADALPSETGPLELATRMGKIACGASLPRHRQAGPLTLDLLHRDARMGDLWLYLHPREFALLWRLAETPGRLVTRAQLLGDVWRLRHQPETNSLEVHVCRLRAKLQGHGLGWLVRTHADGGYQLGGEGGSSFRDFPRARRETLDSLPRLGEGARPSMRRAGERHAVERAGSDRAR